MGTERKGRLNIPSSPGILILTVTRHADQPRAVSSHARRIPGGKTQGARPGAQIQTVSPHAHACSTSVHPWEVHMECPSRSYELEHVEHQRQYGQYKSSSFHLPLFTLNDPITPAGWRRSLPALRRRPSGLCCRQTVPPVAELRRSCWMQSARCTSSGTRMRSCAAS